jgi:hypothetical protein
MRSRPGFGVHARSRCVARFALALGLIAVLALGMTGVVASLQSGAFAMFPIFALSIVLLIRPYLGERAIAQLRARRAARVSRAHNAKQTPQPRRPAHALVARGGRLIAVALAGRAPPVAPARCC